MRTEYQVLVIPFIKDERNETKYVVFKRADNSNWQFIAGGGEDSESPLEAAKRETREEAGITASEFYFLKTIVMIPITEFKDHKSKKGLYVIPEYCFAVEMKNAVIYISNEHTDYKLLNYTEADSLLRYDGNKTALWELNERIKANDLDRV
jgi:dATP pyrophosphohydrolase